MNISDIFATQDAVIFDLFFTLVSPDVVIDKFPPTYQILGVDKAMWRQQTFGTSNMRLTGAETDPYEIVRSMAHAIDPTISTAVIRDATEQRIGRFEHVLMNVPDTTISTLIALRKHGLKTALISNADAIETRAWGKSRLAPLFDVCVISWQVGSAKPDAKIYNHCLNLLDVAASRAVFVGDGGSDELSGANAAGLTTVFAKGLMPEMTEREVLSRQNTADYTIDGLHELLPNGPCGNSISGPGGLK